MLEAILKNKREELSAFIMPEEIELPDRRSLRTALLNRRRSVGLIAEVKRSSPSKGVLNAGLDPVRTAQAYRRAGADAVSVLTDRVFFNGHPSDLTAVKRTTDLPVLRKDFIIDRRQIEESRRIGADAILLIARAMEPARLYELYLEAEAVGLECLVEIHNLRELEAVLAVFQPAILGVNNRNLTTFETSLTATTALLDRFPSGSLIVSESGFKTKDDVKAVEGRVDAILVGEALVTAATPEEGVARLFGEADR